MNNNLFSGTSISGLLCGRGPLAVFLAVIAIVVFSVDAFAIRSFSHVLKESRKAIQPSAANRNSSSSVIFVVLAVLRGASPDHFNPRSVSWRIQHSVTSSAISGQFTKKTSAGFGVTILEMLRTNGCFDSAIATSEPLFLRGIGFDYAENYEFSVSASGAVYETLPPLDLRRIPINLRVSFIHIRSMFGVSEPPALTGGFRASGCQS